MGEKTEIAWCDHTFNCWWGCQRVSPGCEHCYAETFAKRTGKAEWGAGKERRFFGDKHWAEPLKWNAKAAIAGVRHRVFCASMADVFEDRRDLDAQRDRLWKLIEETPWLDWQLLTKRPENMVRLAPERWASAWPSNVWAGATVEDEQRAAKRLPHLRLVPARVRFISAEPLLGPVASDLNGIQWAIIGGESGPGARPFDVASARALLEACRSAGVAPFVKQFGARPLARSRWDMGENTFRDADANGWQESDGAVIIPLRASKGGDMAEWPEDLRVREFPQAPGDRLAGTPATEGSR